MADRERARFDLVGRAVSDVLITGGTGVVGRALLDYRPDGLRVTVTSRDADGFLQRYPRFIHPDIQVHERGQLPLFPSVIHAERSLPWWSLGCAQKRFLFLSSGAARLHISPYADSKRRGEEICRKAKRDLIIGIARLYTIAGPEVPRCYAFGEFIARAREGETIRVSSDGVERRTYMHVRDMAEWLWAMLWSGGEYEVGSQFPVSIMDLAIMIAHRASCRVVTQSIVKAPDYIPTGPFPPGCVERCTLEDAIKESLAA